MFNTRDQGPALEALRRSVRSGLLVLCLLSMGISLLERVVSGQFGPLALVVLTGLHVVIALGAVWLLGSTRAVRGPRPLDLAVWQTLVLALGSGSAWWTSEPFAFPNPVFGAAAALAGFVGTVPGFAGQAILIGASAVLPGPPGAAIDRVLEQGMACVAAWAASRAVLRGTLRVDVTVERLLEAERVASVSLAVRRDRLERMRVLHDTVLATLTAVARGLAIEPNRLPSRCAEDLDRLRGPDLLVLVDTDGRADISGHLVADAVHKVAHESAALGLSVRVAQVGTPEMTLPIASAEALVGGLAAALSNVWRHAGVTQAEVTLTWAADTVRLSVRDEGRGFDPHRPTTRLGLRESITARALAVGGAATVDSQPGAGTTIHVVVPTFAGSYSSHSMVL
ncbi:MAG: sensor histidine kinase [Pseudonocardiaceae bacterium]